MDRKLSTSSNLITGGALWVNAGNYFDRFTFDTSDLGDFRFRRNLGDWYRLRQLDLDSWRREGETSSIELEEIIFL